MARTLKSELREIGYPGGSSDFRSLIIAVFRTRYPYFTDEHILCDPLEAMRFCELIRVAADCHSLPDRLILKTLINTRKQCRPEIGPRRKKDRPLPGQRNLPFGD